MSTTVEQSAGLQLHEFFVTKLHGRRSLRLQFRDNTLILVGENGAGKTTVINLLYYFLSRQWSRLAQFEFETIGVQIADRTIALSKDMLHSVEDSKRWRHHLSLAGRERLRLVLEEENLEVLLANKNRLHLMAENLHVPLRVFQDMISEHLNEPALFVDDLRSRSEAIKQVVPDQILYLPTYRRIEQDLKSIFPDLEDTPFKERIVRRRTKSTYVDLVEFGMEDVERDIERRMTQLKDEVRARLNSLATTYLRDVIAGEWGSISAQQIEPAELATIESVLSRIDEKTLPGSSKDRLRAIVSKIERGQIVDVDERVIALFLFRLVELHRRQHAAESNVRRFVEICNRYLVGKSIVYDEDAFTISVHLTSQLRPGDSFDSEGTILLKHLSSGEKQIVSLFSHLYLSELGTFFVLIDEPELSLSVPWQRSFLPDIHATGRCSGMVAVTHSPFIFENKLDRYAQNLNESWR